MKLRSLTLGLLIAAFAHTGKAQTYKEAKQLLETSSQKMKSFKNLYLEFNYSLQNKAVEPPVTQNEQGTIAIKGNNYHLSFLGTEQIRNGNKLYTILNADQEVQITSYDPKEEDQGLTPARILNLYQKGYSYKMGETKNLQGRPIQFVVLKPTASDITEKIEVGIDRETLLVYSLQQWDVNGSVTHFVVTQAEPNKKFEGNYFQFNRSQYSDYYIAD